MNKFLSLLWIGTLSISILVLGGCSKSISFNKTSIKVEDSESQVTVSSKKDLDNKTSKSKFGKKEIKEFLLEADSWYTGLGYYSEQTKNILGLGIKNKFIVPIVKVNSSKIADGEEVSLLKKFYASDDLIKKKLARAGIYYINGIRGEIEGIVPHELTFVIRDSKIKILKNEENRKVIDAEVFYINHIDTNGRVFKALENNITDWRRYEICKNEKNEWLITDEKSSHETLNIIPRIYPKLSKMEFSSFLKNYPVKHICDNDLNTAWVEGVKGDGVGEWIKLYFEKETEISKIQIFNGYHKSEDLKDKNNKFKKAKIEFSNGQSKIISFDQYNDKLIINLDRSIKTKYIKLSILEVYKGSKYTDTCISEMLFFN